MATNLIYKKLHAFIQSDDIFVYGGYLQNNGLYLAVYEKKLRPNVTHFGGRIF